MLVLLQKFVEVGGIPIRPITLEGIVGTLETFLGKEGKTKGLAFCFVNANTVVEANNDSKYLSVLKSNELNVCDGTPVFGVLKIKTLTSQLDASRTPGPDVFSEITKLYMNSVPQYFIGANYETLEKLAIKIGIDFDENFFFSPPYTDNIDDLYSSVAVFLEGKENGIVWLGLGGRKQDFVAIMLKDSHPSAFLGVGAAFDFSAGVLKRSPLILRKLGLEWVYRLALEPRRLYRRYLVGNAQFLWIILSQALRGKRSK